MATRVINTRLQLRSDTAANWSASNPILLLGEAGYEKDTRKLKIGDGVTAWNSLQYFGSNGSGNIVLRGYYYNNTFYIDAEHTVTCEKSINYIYIDKQEPGSIYTWDGTQYVAAVKLDNKSIVKTEDGISLSGYKNASQGQIPVKNETNGLSWIDPDKALDRDEIIEVLN